MRRMLALMLPLLGLSACSGSGGGGAGSGRSLQPQTPPPPLNQSIGGIWEGTNLRGDKAIGIVTEDGHFHFGHSFGLQIGDAAVSVNQVHSDSTYLTIRRIGFADSSNRLECTLTGVVAERQTLVLDSDCHVERHLSDQFDFDAESSLMLTYNPVYEQGARLETIAGLYQTILPPAPGALILVPLGPLPVLRIDSNGRWFQQSVSDGRYGPVVCTDNGDVSIPNPTYNIYYVTYVRSCNPSVRGLDLRWSGYATLDTSTEPHTLIYTTYTDLPDPNDASRTYALAETIRKERIQ